MQASTQERWEEEDAQWLCGLPCCLERGSSRCASRTWSGTTQGVLPKCPNELLEQRLCCLIDTCCSVRLFTVLQDFVQVRGSVVWKDFHASWTGPRHVPYMLLPFHGSCAELWNSFVVALMGGFDKDGGVDVEDSNGWTAIHCWGKFGGSSPDFLAIRSRLVDRSYRQWVHPFQ
jgi:hypothetical protein